MRLPHLCTIQKATAGTADAYGEPGAPTYSTDVASVPCRFYYTSPGETATRPVSGAAVADTLQLVLGPSATPTLTKRVTTTQAGYTGTYRIEAIRPRSNLAGALHHYELTLVEVPA